MINSAWTSSTGSSSPTETIVIHGAIMSSYSTLRGNEFHGGLPMSEGRNASQVVDSYTRCRVWVCGSDLEPIEFFHHPALRSMARQWIAVQGPVREHQLSHRPSLTRLENLRGLGNEMLFLCRFRFYDAEGERKRHAKLHRRIAEGSAECLGRRYTVHQYSPFSLIIAV